MANPSGLAAWVSYYYTDSAGNDFGAGTIQVSGSGQMAAFLDQNPFYTPGLGARPVSEARSFTFSSPTAISVVALRGFTNERGEFLMTSLPVTDVSTTTTESAYIPHFADGGGWATQIVLLNPTDSAISGNVTFLGTGTANLAATPVPLTVDGQNGSSFGYTIPPRSSVKLRTSGGVPTEIRTGSLLS